MARVKGEIRRKRIMELLSASRTPISGGRLAEEMKVSRQVIVGDIARLRQTCPNLLSTSSGYVLVKPLVHQRIFKVNHSDEQTREELELMTGSGCTVVDVFIEHRIYGTIRKPLQIRTKEDVDHFMEDLSGGVSTPLLGLTQGYHYHTLSADSEADLDRAQAALQERGFLIETVDNTENYEPKKYSGN